MHNDKPTVTSRIANWKDDKEVLSAIRHQVFVQEQSVPEEMEWDDYDESSTHYLATMNNRVVAVARLKPDGQLGRMAVLSESRHQGIGSSLLHFILLDIKDKGLSGIYLHAQVSAISFYQKHGFKEDGLVFYEANIAHRQMFLEY